MVILRKKEFEDSSKTLPGHKNSFSSQQLGKKSNKLNRRQ
jgi:hypothetical protein